MIKDRDEIIDNLAKFSDVNLVESVMSLTNLIQQHAEGHAKELADYQAITLTVLFQRFCPEVFMDALAVREEHS